MSYARGLFVLRKRHERVRLRNFQTLRRQKSIVAATYRAISGNKSVKK